MARILVQDIRKVMLMMRMLHCARQVLHDVAPIGVVLKKLLGDFEVR